MKKITLIILTSLVFSWISYAYTEEPNLKNLVNKSSAIVIGKVEKVYGSQNVYFGGEARYGRFVVFNVEKYLKESLKKELAEEQKIIIFSEGTTDVRDTWFEEGERYLVFLSEFPNPPEKFSQDVVYGISLMPGKFIIQEDKTADYWGIFGSVKGNWLPIEEAINKINQVLKR